MGGCEQEVFVWGRSQGGGGCGRVHVYIWRCVRGGSMSIRSTFLPFSVRLNMETGLSSCTYGGTPLCHFHFHRGTVGGEGGGEVVRLGRRKRLRKMEKVDWDQGRQIMMRA